MVKIDPYNTKEKYFGWKEKAMKNGILGLTSANSQIIMQYLQDMEQGLNVAVSNKKGGRSPLRLNSLSVRITFLAKRFQEKFSLNLLQMEETHLFSFFADMRNGSIKRKNGGSYKTVADYVKDMKSFWHWHMKVHRKKGIDIRDITLDLDTSKEKPDWVYLTEDQVKQICAGAEYKYEVLIWFLFDSGIRAPTELVNVKVSDFLNDYKELNIREECSKTFGRRIKLMLSNGLIKEYIKSKNLTSEDYVFPIDHSVVNRTLKRLAKKILGDKVSPAGQKYSELTMYDFRHNSCCYWLPRYKSESALKYRFGWKKSEKIHYYSELLGMRDTIAEDDMYVDITKTELEKKLERSDKDKAILQEKVHTLELQMVQIIELVNQLKNIRSS
ncbi:MAG: hypothetical protein AABY07_09935 [Nanoarchaeota archaeon]